MSTLSFSHSIKPMPPKRTRKSKPKRPRGDRRPDWWLSITNSLDLPGRLAERLEERWQPWWGPAIMLAFPILFLILAFIIAALR